LNVILLFTWLFLLTRSATVSGVAAALFAVHPIHHERVVWIAARDSLLSTLFMLASLILYVWARRSSEKASITRNGSAGGFIVLSLGFFVLSLLSYEGAVVLPGILIGLEFFLLARPAESVWSRLRSALAKVLPFAIVLVTYLAWWVILFRGAIGQYDLSYSAENLLGNYYRLCYQLFYGNQHLAGVLYFVLLLLALLLSHDRLSLVWFSIFFTVVCFLPFVFIAGFTSRFAYASAIGFAAIVALLLSACTCLKKKVSVPAFRFMALPIAATIFLTLSTYYALILQARISEWKVAGEIAYTIPRQIKTLRPDLPDGSTLVLSRIPRMHGHAYVYPLGLKSSIERFYPGRNLQVFYGPGDMREILGGRDINDPNTILFRYVPDHGSIEEVVAMQK
jgi:hypothetical protein